MPSAKRYRRQKATLASQGTTPFKERVAPKRLERLGVTRSQAAGKPQPGEPSVRELFSAPDFEATIYTGDPGDPANPSRLITFWTDRPSQVRAGRYMRLTRDLREERILPEDFRRRVRRMRPIDGFHPLDDPRAVLALIQTTVREDIVFEYRGRQRPRRARPSQPRRLPRRRGGR
jgi:hypothetical protein